MTESVDNEQVVNSRQCEYENMGTRCRAKAVSGSSLCWAHDPALEEKRAEARRRGGENKRTVVLPADTPDVSLNSAGEVQQFAVRMINRVLRGEIDVKVANAALGWANIFVRLFDTIVFEQRISAVEAAQKMLPEARIAAKADVERVDSQGARQ